MERISNKVSGICRRLPKDQRKSILSTMEFHEPLKEYKSSVYNTSNIKNFALETIETDIQKDLRKKMRKNKNLKKIQKIKSRKNIIFKNSESTINSDMLSLSYHESTHAPSQKKPKKDTKMKMKLDAWKDFKKREKEINKQNAMLQTQGCLNFGMTGGMKFRYKVKSKLHNATRASVGKRNHKFNSCDKKCQNNSFKIYHQEKQKDRLNSISKIYEKSTTMASKRRSSIGSRREVKTSHFGQRKKMGRTRNQSMVPPQTYDFEELLESGLISDSIRNNFMGCEKEREIGSKRSKRRDVLNRSIL